ncbi:hypothetical protein Hanom_Chr02g00144001 [Helianthus anomalus]
MPVVRTTGHRTHHQLCPRNRPISWFTSLLVTDKQRRERWKRVDIELDRHIIFLPDPVNDDENNDDDDEVAVNNCLANLTVSCLLSTAKFSLDDMKTVVRGGAGVELWPRKLATAKFSLDDMKTVKSAVVNSGPNTYYQRHETIEVVERWIFQDDF